MLDGHNGIRDRIAGIMRVANMQKLVRFLPRKSNFFLLIITVTKGFAYFVEMGFRTFPDGKILAQTMRFLQSRSMHKIAANINW